MIKEREAKYIISIVTIHTIYILKKKKYIQYNIIYDNIKTSYLENPLLEQPQQK